MLPCAFGFFWCTCAILLTVCLSCCVHLWRQGLFAAVMFCHASECAPKSNGIICWMSITWQRRKRGYIRLGSARMRNPADVSNPAWWHFASYLFATTALKNLEESFLANGSVSCASHLLLLEWVIEQIPEASSSVGSYFNYLHLACPWGEAIVQFRFQILCRLVKFINLHS